MFRVACRLRPAGVRLPFGAGAGPIRPAMRPAIAARLLSTQQYNEIADEALEAITESYENLIEQKPEIDVDLGQGVLTVVTPPIGTYVINKQPPNKQIWLSSPISGPKRYDYHEAEGRWVYDRDHSSLGGLLRQETRDSYQLELPLDLDQD